LTVVRRLLSVLICFASANFVVVTGARAEPVAWLYEVEVPVENQSAAARLSASRVAMLELLTRVTGLNHVPRGSAVSGALAAPDLYYNQFRFVEVETLDEDGLGVESLRLRIQFERTTVLRLLKDAALPIWRANRPKVVAWVVVDANGTREILGADSRSEVAESLLRRAKQRGVPLVLPLLDLEDQILVDPAAVWGRLSAVLEPASARYGADIVLVGRVQAIAGGSWAVAWEFWIDGEHKPFAGQGLDLVGLAGQGVDFLANELVQRYAVLGRSSRDIRLGIAGIVSPADYGDLLRYLGSLEFVEEVNLQTVQGDRLGLVVRTRAEPQQLLKMFKVDRHLFELGLSSPSGIELMWQRP
jgi:hypothetical protein